MKIDMTAAELARLFHETYEDLAPSHGYSTRERTRKAWEDIPEGDPNKRLMIATCGVVLGAIEGHLEAELAKKQSTVEFVDTEIGPMRRGRFPEGWTMPEPPYEGCRPVAEDIDGGWLLQWFDEDDCYAGEIPWPVGPAEAVTLEDLKAAGFVIGLGGEE